MAQFAITLRANNASDILDNAIATDGAGAFYAVVKTTEFTGPCILKINDDATIAWQVGFTMGAGTGTIPVLASNGTTVAVCWSGSSPAGMMVALLNASNGSVIWQERLTTLNIGYNVHKHKVLIDSVGDIIVIGRNTNTQHYVIKLAAANGVVIWAKNIVPTSETTGWSRHGLLALMSDDDVLVGSFSDDATVRAGIYRLNASDGALVWAREVTWDAGIAANNAQPPLLAVDLSTDDFYVVSQDIVSTDAIEVIKVNSSGTTVWSALLTDTNTNHYLKTGGGAWADATGLFIGAAMGEISPGDYNHAGTVRLNAAGTSATALRWTTETNDYTNGCEAIARASADCYTLFTDQISGEFFPVICKTEDTLDPGTNPVYSGFDFPLTVTAGLGSVSSFSPTLPSDPSITRTVTTLSTGTPSSLVTQLFELGPIAPPSELVRYAYGFKTGTFGAPRNSYSWPVVGFNGTTFGAPALDLNLEPEAQGFLPTRYGAPFAFATSPPGPRAFYPGGLRSTTFGSPTAARSGQYAQLSADPSTQFGGARARLSQAASGLVPTAQFGMVGAALRQRPSGFQVTTFGATAAVRITYAQGLLSGSLGTPRSPGAAGASGGLPFGFLGTELGTPRAVSRHATTGIAPTTVFGAAATLVAEGFRATVFGVPSAVRLAQASGFISGAFGTPRAPGAVFGRYYDLTGFTSTALGTPRLRLRQPASSIAPATTFGSINAQHALGFKATSFGAAVVVRPGYPAGFSGTAFGTPRAPGAQFGRHFDLVGFSGTQIGTPRVRMLQAAATIAPATTFGAMGQNYLVSGFKPLVFGSPTALRPGQTVGFQTGVFGTPRAPGAQYGGYFDVFGQAPATQIGTPRARMPLQATTIAPTATFGAPATTSAAGFVATAFGAATAVRVGAPLGLSATQFGTPRAPGAIFGRYYDLEGFLGTSWGLPRARSGQPAGTVGAITAFGAASAVMRPRSAGFQAAQFGQPLAAVVVQAGGFLVGGVGTPRSPQPDQGLPFGFLATSFGAPRASRAAQIELDGFTTTAFGGPTALQAHRASRTGPLSRLGQPYVARTCPP